MGASPGDRQGSGTLQRRHRSRADGPVERRVRQRVDERRRRTRREDQHLGSDLGGPRRTTRRTTADGPGLHHRQLHRTGNGTEHFWRPGRRRPRRRNTREVRTLAHFPKPDAGSWTENYPELGTAPVDYTDSIDPAFFEAERDAAFKKAWLTGVRTERLPRTGSYFTKELPSAGKGMSVIIVKTKDGSVKAFHNVCRHRGNKLVWNDFPNEEPSGPCRQFTCRYLDCGFSGEGDLTLLQLEGEFFDGDKSVYGLVGVRCELWEGVIFINVDQHA